MTVIHQPKKLAVSGVFALIHSKAFFVLMKIGSPIGFPSFTYSNSLPIVSGSDGRMKNESGNFFIYFVAPYDRVYFIGICFPDIKNILAL